MKESSDEKTKESGSLLKQFTLPLIVLLICVAATAGLKALNTVYTNQTTEYQEWMESTLVTERHDTALELEAENESLSTAISTMQETETNLETYPDVTTELWNRIQAAGGDAITVSLQGYDSTTGVISFLATSAQVIDIPSYVKQLQETGVFYEVSYTGYAYGDNVYQLSLSCALAADETQEESAEAAEDSAETDAETSGEETGGDAQ